MIRRFKVGYDVELEKRTLQSGLLSLVGPQAQAVAMRASDDEAGAAGPAAELAAGTLELELRALPPPGIDRFSQREADTHRRPAGRRSALRRRGHRHRAQRARRGGRAAGERGGCEIVRVEHGRPRYGVDLDDSVIPQEAGLNERAVSFTKGCYVGQETVARLYYKGKPNRHLRGLRLTAPAAAGEELHLSERIVGRVGSSVVSPELGPIALALVRREAEPGTIVGVGEHGASAEVAGAAVRALTGRCTSHPPSLPSPAMAEDLRIVTTVGNEAEAEMVAERLSEAGIRFTVRLAGGGIRLGAAAGRDVCVDGQDLDRAREVLEVDEGFSDEESGTPE